MIFVQGRGVVTEDKSEEGGKSKQRAREKERRQEAREREGEKIVYTAQRKREASVRNIW